LSLATFVALGIVALGSFLLGYDHGALVVSHANATYKQGKDLLLQAYRREKDILAVQTKHLTALSLKALSAVESQVKPLTSSASEFLNDQWKQLHTFTLASVRQWTH
jgi:hypothetical protein